MIGLITDEELAALLGDKFALAAPVVQKFNTREHSEAIQPQIRIALVESTPIPSLRNLISAEEIAALLACFPIDDRISYPKIARKRDTRRKSQSKSFRRP